MRKIVAIVLLIHALVVLSSCGHTAIATPQNILSAVSLSDEQQEIANLLSTPYRSELFLFDFAIEEAFRSIDVWVEFYQYGERTDLMAINHVIHSDTTTISNNGRLSVVIWQFPVAQTPIWQGTNSILMLSSSCNGLDVSATANGPSIELIPELNAYHSRHSPMLNTVITDGKEIILCSWVYFESDYSDYSLTQPGLLNDYPFAMLIKCRFSK